MSDTARAPDGTFLKGQSGNPAGRPPGKKDQLTVAKQDLELAIRRRVKPEQISRIVDKMIALAEEGNTRAAKLILDKTMSNVTDSADVSAADGGVTFVVKNATLAVTSEATPPIDITPEHEESS